MNLYGRTKHGAVADACFTSVYRDNFGNVSDGSRILVEPLENFLSSFHFMGGFVFLSGMSAAYFFLATMTMPVAANQGEIVLSIFLTIRPSRFSW